MSDHQAVVDASGWMEVFSEGLQAEWFLTVLAAEARLVVPTIALLELFKWVLREHSQTLATQAAAVMQRGLVVNLDTTLALAASQFSHELRLSMADNIILATAKAHQARLFTMDADFRGLPDVELIEKS